MDRERLTVAAPNLDDELRRLVAVTPSPEFEARVRAHLADIETVRDVRGLWLWGSAMAAAALVIAAVVLTPRGAGDERLTTTTFAPPVATLRPSWSSTLVRSNPPAVTVAPTAMEVIVQRGQAAALLQFAALTATGRIVDAPASQGMILSAPAADTPLPPLTIAPVTIEPLVWPVPPSDPK